ncbi:hypothetical protein GCM10009789_11220 [Kribbella sancticallisti]|uniref:Helix-turn-helix domain-containing protein n=1 Tax=Kribbella sancticallisti TaxID=460087 RepID=A0ABP4NEK2_9ACTN
MYGWRVKKYGPPTDRVGRHLRYDRQDVIDWYKTSVTNTRPLQIQQISLRSLAWRQPAQPAEQGVRSRQGTSDVSITGHAHCRFEEGSAVAERQMEASISRAKVCLAFSVR